ncbi:MAG: hypothetical protein VX335_01605, partial [Pseudomonadota bacterium]|nr:hypothetical protein [Pseudomonadota bacterium]
GKATATLLKGIKDIVGNKVLQSECEETIKGQKQSPLAAISVILQNISNLPETNATLSGGFHAIFSTNEIKAAINRLDNSELIPLRHLIKNNSEFIKETIKQAAGGTIQAKLLMHTVIMPALCAIDADLATAIQGLEPTLFNKARVATVTFMTGGALTTGVGVVGATFGTVGAFLTSGAKGAKDFGSRVKNFITGTGKSPKSSPKAKTPQFGNSIGVAPLSSDNFAKIDGGGHNKTFSGSSTNSPSSVASFRGGRDENKHPNIGSGPRQS